LAFLLLLQDCVAINITAIADKQINFLVMFNKWLLYLLTYTDTDWFTII
jgi:hypothetical protein